MNTLLCDGQHHAAASCTDTFHVAAFVLAASVAVPFNGVIMNAMAAYKYALLPRGLFIEGALFIAALTTLCVWLLCARRIRRASSAQQCRLSAAVCTFVLLAYAVAKVVQFVYFT